jgi:hypothetical protein
MRNPAKVVYRSMQGKEVDMNKLMSQNELTVAVGNVRVNARGDELGPGGRIIRRADESVNVDHHIPDEINTRNVAVASVTEAPINTVELPSRSVKSVAPAITVKNTDQSGNA